MAGALLQCDDVSFGYGGGELFRGISFMLTAGQRLGLVAPNGAGKTTLLRIVAGTLTPDSGRVIRPSSARLGYVEQSHTFAPDATVLDTLMSGFAEAIALRTELEQATAAVARGEPGALDKLASVQDRYELTGGHALESRLAALGEALGFGADSLGRKIHSLSGGERGRLALGVALAPRPEVLLLDEPTNHLDVETTERVEGMLRDHSGAAVIVSHDRAFLDATCNVTAELGSRTFRVYNAPYSKYVELREADLERERRQVDLQREEIARTEDFIRKNLAGQKTKQAKSRRKMLEKTERLERPEDVWASARRLGLRFAPCERSGEQVLVAQGLTAERGGRQLFSGVEIVLRRGERVGIVGPNGTGKTTLLKMLAGERTSDDLGTARIGSNVRMAYFDQHLESVDPARSAIEEIRTVRPEMVDDAAREYLAKFQFWGDDPFRAAATLSGGERTRLALAKMLLVPRNFLLLDEPTNHLDIPSTEILEEALRHFEGSAVFVSHDRYLLDRVATHILHIHEGQTTLSPGGYGDFVRMKNRPLLVKKTLPRPEKAVARDAHDERKAVVRVAERRKRHAQELEKSIEVAEKEVLALRQKLVGGEGDWQELARLAEQEQALSRKIERMTEEWAKLSDDSP